MTLFRDSHATLITNNDIHDVLNEQSTHFILISDNENNQAAVRGNNESRPEARDV